MRRLKVSDYVLEDMISNEVETAISLVGYRQMTEIISMKYGIHVAKERVRCMLKRLDPEGVKERKDQGNVLKEGCMKPLAQMTFITSMAMIN